MNVVANYIRRGVRHHLALHSPLGAVTRVDGLAVRQLWLSIRIARSCTEIVRPNPTVINARQFIYQRPGSTRFSINSIQLVQVD